MATKKKTQTKARAKQRSLAIVATSSTPPSFMGALVRGRLIPVTIAFATLLLGIKVADIIRGTNELSERFLASNAQAISPEEEAAAKAKEESDKEKTKTEEEKKPEGDAKKDEAKSEGDKPAEGEHKSEGDAPKESEKKDEAKSEGDKPAEGEHKSEGDAPKESEKKDESKTEGDKPAEGDKAAEGEHKSEGEHGGEKKDEAKKEAKKVEKPKKPEKREFSQVEVDILESLSSRREELAKWEDDVRTKERLLEATEVRLDKKIAETKKLEETVKGLLVEYNKHEDEKIKSLVKIYENMKPVDAARIFDELEMPVLVMVVDKMNERKVAPVLAKMSPVRAKQLTMELAEDRKLRETVDDTLNPQAK